MKESVIHSSLPPGFASLAASGMDARAVKALCMDTSALADIGLHLPKNVLGAMDAALSPNVTTPSIPGLLQFLQAWLPGFVETMTRARKIDDLVGVTTAGAWEDEEVVQGMLEPVGLAVPYSDVTPVSLASWDLVWERRTIVRFEKGMEVGKLEERRAGRAMVNSAARKRAAAGLALDIQRNRIGFYGYMDGAGRTFGFLNDPSLPAYVTVPGGTWATKTFLQITADIRSALQALRVQSGDNIDPKTTSITMAIATSAFEYLTVTSDFGNSVMDWLTSTYPNVRVETAPELDGANGGANVFYLYADRVEDGGDDGGQTFVQIVPSRFMALGVENKTKTYVEDYSNATAGVMVKRPFAVVRRSGI